MSPIHVFLFVFAPLFLSTICGVPVLLAWLAAHRSRRIPAPAPKSRNASFRS